MPLIIEKDEECNVCKCIEGTHTVHADGKRNSELNLTMGKGSMMIVSKKLGLVTASSTETEVVSAGEHFPKCTWFRCFRMAQEDTMK